jgi:hypothetical protein
MNGRWELVLHEKAVRVFLSRRGSERRMLEKSLDALAENPYLKPDGEFKDGDGRLHSIVRSGNWTVVYWLDAFVKELRIVSLEKVV